MPRKYHSRFNTAAMTNNEFFRKNAPKSSVARSRKISRRGNSFNAASISRNSTGNFTKSFMHRRQSAVTNNNTSLFGGSRYDTPFLLDKEPGNKFKVCDAVEKTVRIQSEIPFLRSSIDPNSFSKTYTSGFSMGVGNSSMMSRSGRKKTRTVKK